MIAKKDKPTIRSIYNPSEKEATELQFVYDRFQQLKEARMNTTFGNLETIWDRQAKQWDAYRGDVSKEAWQTDIYIPITTSIIESQLAEVFDQSPMPVLTPRNRYSVIAAKALSHVFKDAWLRSGSDVEHFLTLKSAFIHGNGIWQESFLEMKRKVKDIVAINKETGELKIEERDINEYQGVFGENVSLFDFYPDDKGRYLRIGPYACRDVIRRYIMNIDDFHEMFSGPIMDPLGNSKYVQAGGDTEYYEFYKPNESVEKNEVEVLWYWSRYPDDALIIVANDVMMRSTPNPHAHKQLPFASAIDYARLNNFWAKGEPDILESIQEELNVLRRMRLDRAHLDIDKPFLISSRETLDDEDLIIGPHKGIFVDDVNSIKPVEYSNIDNSAYLEEDRLKEDAVRVSGVDDRFQAVQKGGTATEAAILRESTLKRIRMKMRFHEKSFLPRVAEQRIKNIQQFYSDPMLSEVVGDQNTEEFKALIAELRERKELVEEVGKNGVKTYKQKGYRTIPMFNKKLAYNEAKTDLIEQPGDGWFFFEVKPEFIRGEISVDYETGSSIPISKPLEQQRNEALFQHPVVAMAIQGGYYDIGKAADFLVKDHDISPDELKKVVVPQQKSFSLENSVDPQQAIDLAKDHITLLMQGQKVPPMPYVTADHIKVHIAYMNSPEFAQVANTDKKLLKNYINHTYGEIAILQERENSGAQQPPNEVTNQPASMGSPAQSIGGGAPEGQQFPATAIQPSPNKISVGNMQSMMPGRIEGGNNAMTALPK